MFMVVTGYWFPECRFHVYSQMEGVCWLPNREVVVMPYPRKSLPFVFEEWASLAQTDPKAFEEQRQQYIESFISMAPGRQRNRLERLQWRIDMERKRASTPLSACVRISRMMMDSVYGDTGLVKAIKGEITRDEKSAAKVIEIGHPSKRKD